MSNFFLILKTAELQQQQNNFKNLLKQLGKADVKEIETALSQREIVKPELELTPDITNSIKTKIQNQRQ